MIGADIACISRLLIKPHLLDSILSKEEIELYKKAVKKEEFLPRRFPFKKNLFKTSHLESKDIPSKETKVLYNNIGVPIIMHNNKEYEFFNLTINKMK